MLRSKIQERNKKTKTLQKKHEIRLLCNSEHTLITKPEEPKDIKKRNKVSKEQSVRSGNKKRKKYLDCKTERDERETKEKRKLSDINW